MTDLDHVPGSTLSGQMAPGPIAPADPPALDVDLPDDDEPDADEVATRGAGIGVETGTDDDDEAGDDMTAAGDYPILAKPSIGVTAFGSILRNAGSPAASEYIGIYNAAVEHGVDPAVLLAVFQHESSFGKAGAAAHTKNIGNLVYTPTSARMGATKSGRWAAYSSWTQSAQDTARLLAVYGRNAIRPGKTTSTVRTFPHVWAPSSDGNRPVSYGSALAHSIAQWTGKGGTPVSVATHAARPSKNAKAAAKAAPHAGVTVHQAASAAAARVAPLPAALGGVSLVTVAGVALVGLAVVILIVALARSGGSSDEE